MDDEIVEEGSGEEEEVEEGALGDDLEEEESDDDEADGILDAYLEENEDGEEEGEEKDETDDAAAETKEDGGEEGGAAEKEIYDLEEEGSREEGDLGDEFGLEYGETTDAELADAGRISETFEDYIAKAAEDGREIEDSFFSMAIRNGISPRTMEEHGLYSFADMNAHMEELQERNDPGAIVFPKDGTQEEIADFYEKYENIPRTAEGYDEGIFKNTVFEDNKEGQDWLKDHFAESRLSGEQAAYMTELFHNEKKFAAEEAEEDVRAYAREQKGEIEDSYRGDLKARTQDIASLLRKNFPELLDEVKGTKLYYSKAFFDAFGKIADMGSGLDRVDFSKVGKTLGGISDTKLDEMLTQAARAENLDPEKLKDERPSVRKSARNAQRKYDIIYREMRRRDLV